MSGESRPIHIIVRDLDRAHRNHALTPSFIDEYAMRYGVSVPGLYQLALRNSININIEEGRNDFLLNEKTWDSAVNESAVQQALDEQSVATFKRLRAHRADGRPAALRKASQARAAFKVAPQASTATPVHRCGPNCTVHS